MRNCCTFVVISNCIVLIYQINALIEINFNSHLSKYFYICKKKEIWAIDNVSSFL